MFTFCGLHRRYPAISKFHQIDKNDKNDNVQWSGQSVVRGILDLKSSPQNCLKCWFCLKNIFDSRQGSFIINLSLIRYFLFIYLFIANFQALCGESRFWLQVWQATSKLRHGEEFYLNGQMGKFSHICPYVSNVSYKKE